jgi:polar amino acid transport system ATP-binding protein
MREEDCTLLSAVDLCKEYKGHRVLDHVSLNVVQGEKIVILGPSGAGKSTLLRCLHLLEPVQKGQIYLQGNLVNSYKKDGRYILKKTRQTAATRSRMATVFQSFNLFPHMTVLQNIIEGPIRTLGMQKKQAIEQAIALLEKIGLDNKRNAYPSQLSGGQGQRVAIMRAVAMNPLLMFFDEVTSALDPQLVRSVLDLMRELGDAGMTMIVVTHELGFAREIADRIIYMDEGRIVEDGSPSEIFESAKHKSTRDFFNGVLKGKIEL